MRFSPSWFRAKRSKIFCIKTKARQTPKTGPIYVETRQDLPKVVSEASSPTGTSSQSFHIAGLGSHGTTPTGMREDIILLSWMIVLLRTREDGHAAYEWAYQRVDAPAEKGPGGIPARLAADGVMASLQSNVAEVAAAVRRHILDAPAWTVTGSVCMLLSMGTSQSEKEALQIRVHFASNRLDIRPVSHGDNILPYTITRYTETLVDTLRLCLSHPLASIADLLRPTTHDLDTIWKWNYTLPPALEYCMHEVITTRTGEHPEKVAISSWDGDLTYTQVDRYSTLLASSLRESGVKLNDVVPVCFEKSRWTVVAVLGVMKAGATLVLMDPTLPLARLQNMAIQVGATAMVSSVAQEDFAGDILPAGSITVVGPGTFPAGNPPLPLPQLPKVPSSALMYIIFTSGSTGTPKGVKISHATYTSSAVPRGSAVGYTSTTRTLDFASYAFDVSIDSMFLTLAAGGCLCIPSDADRLDDINRVMRRMKVNYAGITPSVARILELDVISSLTHGLGLGGEAVSARDATLWGKHARIIIGYGPCECTIGCTINSSAATGREYISIGKGNGAAIWIVDPDDHEKLVPVGAVGELLVEGPIVGQGYLNDPEKTAAAFIHDPAWLVSGHGDHPGRKGRLYKTGDLGRYDPDGSGGIVFVGRKDTQVKLRGQRVELGEIESQLKARLPADANVIVEVVPQGTGQPTLLAFIAPLSAAPQDDIQIAALPGELPQALSQAETEIGNVLPRYMVPNAYIPINFIPTLISGKTDRKRLRQFGATVDLRHVDQSVVNNRELTDMERRLRQAWGVLLGTDPETIRHYDNFFGLGGDSLAAMKLVPLCREQGVEITVANTFGHPVLSAMALAVRPISQDGQPVRAPFSVFSSPLEPARREAARACNIAESQIEDIYPCTPTQESLFTFSLKSPVPYLAQRVATIPDRFSLEEWKSAWETIVADTPILRTRLVQFSHSPALYQVVLAEGLAWRETRRDLKGYLSADLEEDIALGSPLVRFGLVTGVDKDYMVLTLHHTVYDGWSEPLILDQVLGLLSRSRPLLQSPPVQKKTEMADFVSHLLSLPDSMSFWRAELAGAIGPQFPAVPSRDFVPRPDVLVERTIVMNLPANWPFTSATLLRGAWALVAARWTGHSDVVFGETLTGRDIPLSGVERIIGPLIATVPVRVRVLPEWTVAEYLSEIQRGVLNRTAHQHVGMQHIRRASRDAQIACETPMGLVFQPEMVSQVVDELGFESGDVVREAIHFNPYSLMLACGMQKGHMRVCASFDSRVVSRDIMGRVLGQLEVVCREMMAVLEGRLGEIKGLGDEELDQIWKWNARPPLSWESRKAGDVSQGERYPRVVVPWVCNPQNFALLAPIGCTGELWLEGDFLPDGESPAWLAAGSPCHAGRQGKVKATGDIVKLQEDGTLVFVGRKETVTGAVNLGELEVYFGKYIPSGAAAVFSETGELLVFVERPSEARENCVSILPAKYAITSYDPSLQSETIICDEIPASLAAALKKLDKFAQNSLASHLAPSAYAVVETLPSRRLLSKLASQIPDAVLAQIRQGLHQVWKNLSQDTTPGESILRATWAKILNISPDQIDVDDNFFRLGGDSVLAMKLVSYLRSQGHGLTVADIFQHMRLGDAARVLKINQAAAIKNQPYRPFSIQASLNINRGDIDLILSEIQPKLGNSQWTIQDVYPTTDSQVLDIKATVSEPRTSMQYTMLYFDRGIDAEQLLRACRQLVRAHDILRTVFVEQDSTFLQVVLQDLVVPVTTRLADGDINQCVVDLYTEHVESEFSLGFSFAHFFVVEGDGQVCLVLGLSHTLYDGISLPRLLRDLETLYTGGKLVGFEPFSTYISHTLSPEMQTESLGYWRDLLQGSSLTCLPRISPDSKAVFHSTPTSVVQPPTGITIATLLSASWTVLLARRLHLADITFGGITSGRGLDLHTIQEIMGPCYQFTPVRVSLQPTWTALDLLQHVQTQSAISSAHDFIGFTKIAGECGWNEGDFFDSLVHHQDWEDFDEIDFAGGKCRVDIANPHGEAARPIKVVSFVKEGKVHVGIVGEGDGDGGFWKEVLGELRVVVEELAQASGEGRVLEF